MSVLLSLLQSLRLTGLVGHTALRVLAVLAVGMAFVLSTNALQGCGKSPQTVTGGGNSDNLFGGESENAVPGVDDSPNVGFATNPTGTSDAGREDFEELEQAVLDRLPASSRVSLRHDGIPVKPGMSNLTPDEAREMLDGFNMANAEQGSDPRHALEQTKDALLASEGAENRPLIMVAHDDCLPDGKYSTDPAADPIKVDWSGGDRIDLVVTGVAPKMKPLLMKAWKGKLHTIHLYSRDDKLQVDQIVGFLPLPPKGPTY